MVKKIIILFTIMSSVLFYCFANGRMAPEAEPISVDNINSDQEYFPIGVWMQGPNKQTGEGKTYAEAYKEIGINTFYGLWKWPFEDSMYRGYATNSVKTLQEFGLKCYAGNSMEAVEWVKDNPEYHDTFLGYMLGDEPDMFKVNGKEKDQPINWAELGMSLKEADPDRELYANFGKGFALEDWLGYKVSPGPTKADDFARYVSPLDCYSFDIYPYTDPYMSDFRRGAYSYGDATEHAILYAQGRPVYGFLEGSAPWKDKTYQVGIDGGRNPLRRMKSEYIYPTVWNMIVNGADGIIYFCHDFSFSNPDGWRSDAGLLYEDGMSEAVRYTNQSVMNYEEILLLPDVEEYDAISSHKSVELKIRVKKAADSTYIFAMGHGNKDYPEGASLEGRIVTSEEGSITVEVMGESRTVTMEDGVIIDSFTPYELHIYRFSK